MWNTKICLGTSPQSGLQIEEQVKLFKKIGFNGFFTDYRKDATVGIKKLADSLGMYYQSIHAPFVNSAKMWDKDEIAKEAVDELKECVKCCADNHIGLMVAHTFIGFEEHTPNDNGIKNYEMVVQYANELGVKIAFENTEGEEYLEAIMKHLMKYPNVGFCWDTGHEMCYNKSKNMMALYGDKILCTHLNDNLGIKDYDGKITYIDDLHLLPFDGIADWNDIVHRLNQYEYNDPLVFELNKKSKPGRYENDVYDKMKIEDYITEVFKRACRVAALKMKDKTYFQKK